MILVLSAASLTLAACGPINIESLTPRDPGVYNGAGADGGAGQG